MGERHTGPAADLLVRAWVALNTGRPGPVLVEVPLDVLRAEAPAAPGPAPPLIPNPPAPSPADVDALARLVTGWQRPLLLAGGGVVSAGAEALFVQLAERLGAPMIHTAMGKCSFPASHPLASGMPWNRATSDVSNMGSFFAPLFAEADGLLAVGCRFTQLATGSWSLKLPPSMAQVDIDPEELGRHYPVRLGVAADARETLRALLAVLPGGREARPPWAAATGGPTPTPTSRPPCAPPWPRTSRGWWRSGQGMRGSEPTNRNRRSR